MSLRCIVVMWELTHAEITKSFPTVSAATLTTFMRMVKSQTHGKGDVLYTGFWAVTNISPSDRPFHFTPLLEFSDWRKYFRGLCKCWLLTHCTSVSPLWLHSLIQTLFGMFGIALKLISSFPPKSSFFSFLYFFRGKKYTPFWLMIQTIKHNIEHHLWETSTLVYKKLRITPNSAETCSCHKINAILKHTKLATT